MITRSFIHHCLVIGVVLAAGVLQAAAEPKPPNIVFILADDLGYGDIGAYGQSKIRTPSLDKLAEEGMRFTRHYSGNAVCAPSRCVLMTGMHPGHAWVRDNQEIGDEGQFSLRGDAQTLAKLLKEAGYTTGAFGKWGLGGPDSPGQPLKQGFDRFFGYNCQRHAHTYYPQTLWDDDKITTLSNPSIPKRARLPEDADPASSASYTAYSGPDYAPDLITDQALRFVRENRSTPFFLYWPTIVPHLGLQVPEDSLQEYLGRWPDPPYPGGKGYVPHYAPRAAYAAMISRMDRDIGRLLNLLDELKLADNTIVVFTSDNGPAYASMGGTDSDFFSSAGSLRGRKGSLLEGGIRVPLIVRWPKHVQPGAVSDRTTGFEDWIPTLLQLAKLSVPQSKLDGISFAPTLLGSEQPPRSFLYREFPGYGGQQAIWAGDWKLIRQNLLPGKKAQQETATKQPTLELYNLKDDPAEEADVSAAHPEAVTELRRIMAQQHQPSGDFPFPPLDKESRALSAAEHGN